MKVSTPNSLHRLRRLLAGLFDSRGSQIAEFAVALPLFMVFVVGIFDFGTAFTVKQRLENATRDGARTGANQPTADLSLGQPASVDQIANVVGNALTSANLNDCGLARAATRTPTNPSTLTWAYTANANGCPGTVTLTVERGYTRNVALPAPYAQNLLVENTRVTLSYPYVWKFDNVIKLVAPLASYPGTTLITTVAMVQNLN